MPGDGIKRELLGPATGIRNESQRVGHIGALASLHKPQQKHVPSVNVMVVKQSNP